MFNRFQKFISQQRLLKGTLRCQIIFILIPYETICPGTEV